MIRIQVFGLRNTIKSMAATNMIMGSVKSKFVESLATQTKERAQDELDNRGFVDTQALYDSIHPKVIKDTTQQTTYDVIAGDANIIRGQGKYTFSRKNNNNVGDISPTEDYAAIVEEIGSSNRGPAKYMAMAYQWAESVAGAKASAMIRTALGVL